MLKLGRNTVTDYKVLRDANGTIKWDHFKNLHDIQNVLTFKFKNKLNAQCIRWYENKMKVKYAVHTLSASVANAMEYLKSENFKEFQDCDSTVTFIRTIDWLFDFMNSRIPFAKEYKRPITRSSLSNIRSIVLEKINYLFSLKNEDGILLTNTGRKTFICGLAIAAKSILEVAEDLFRYNENLKYLLTYRFSQDHLELLFGKIRSRCGFNNNPHVLHFKYAMRQILLRNDIRNSQSTNCLELDNDPIGAVFDMYWKKKGRMICSYQICTY